MGIQLTGLITDVDIYHCYGLKTKKGEKFEVI